MLMINTKFISLIVIISYSSCETFLNISLKSRIVKHMGVWNYVIAQKVNTVLFFLYLFAYFFPLFSEPKVGGDKATQIL